MDFVGNTVKFYTLKKGKPVEATLEFFVSWASAHPEFRAVDLTKLKRGYVSTIFLGIAHPGGCLFETMCFGTGTPHDNACLRYRTMGQAKKGHWKVVDMVQAIHQAPQKG